MAPSGKYIWVDYLRLIATFSVVFLHSAAPLLKKYHELPEEYWMTGNIYDSLVRMCVPLFFMISGLLLLGKSEPLKVFFSKRMDKVLVPLIAWSLIYVFWEAYYEGSETISFSSFYNIFLAPAYYHLWYLYAIIGIYLFLPILRVIIGKADRNLLHYYLLLWFVAVAIIPIGENITEVSSKIDLFSISGYSGYLVLGFLLGKMDITKKLAISAIFIFIISVTVTATGTYFLTVENDGVFSEYFYGYMTPNVILMSASMFILTKYFISKVDAFASDRMLSILKSFSSASFGIYLIHPVFLYLLEEGDLGIVLSGFEGDPAISIPATAVTTFFLSYVTILLLKKIPVINKISP